MVQAKTGDRVMLDYVGTFDDGSVFDSSMEPLEFEIGQGEMLPEFENAVLGMAVGETKTVTIMPKDAYGEYDNDLLFTLDRSELPPDIKPAVGKMLQARSDQGSVIDVIIKDISGDQITMDANHPLAGRKLTFRITLVDIL